MTRITCLLLLLLQGWAFAQTTAPAITLHVKDANPRDVKNLIAKQADATIETWPNNLWTPQNTANASPISFDFDAVPFWTAMSRFCLAAHVRPQFIGAQPGITLQHDDSIAAELGGKMDDRGFYAVVAISIARNRFSKFADGSVVSDDQVSLKVFLHPAITIFRFDPTARVDSAIDDNGVAMAVANAAADDFSGQQWDGHIWTFDVTAHIQFPNNPGSKLADFKGSVRVQRVTKTEPLVIDDLSKAVKKHFTAANHTLTVEKFEIADDHHIALDLTATKTKKASDLMPMLYTEMQSIQIIDGDGNIFRAVPGGGGGSPTRAQWHGGASSDMMHFQSGKPVKLIWNVPTEIQAVDLPFEFKDLPLPQE